MRRHLNLSALLALSAAAAACVDAAPEAAGLETDEQLVTDPAQRVYNIVEAVLPAGNYDGVAGNECVALLNPEHRLRKVILVQAAGPGGSCALTAYAAGNAVSFTWGDTSAYSNSGGAAAIRAALSDDDGAVHRLTGTTTSEATALAALNAFLLLSDAQQTSQLDTLTSKRVHTIYDFEGAEEVKAEAAYQAVRVTQPCENPGDPGVYARFKDGFVYGYTATNTGSCHSGWFTRRHSYNRTWKRVGTYEYSE